MNTFVHFCVCNGATTTVILVIITWESSHWRSLDVRRAKLPCGRIPDHRRQKSKNNNHRWTFHPAPVAMCPDQPQQSAPLASPAHKELPSPPSFSVLRCSASAGLLDRPTIIIMYPSGVLVLAKIIEFFYKNKKLIAISTQNVTFFLCLNSMTFLLLS